MRGSELKKIVLKSGKTQKEIADAFGMQPSQWTTYFKQADVKSGLLERTARYLGMTMGELYGEACRISDGEDLKGATVVELIKIVRSKDKQIEECQQQISRLISLLEASSQGQSIGTKSGQTK